MSQHTIITCHICHEVWDLDMMAEACTCDDVDESINTQEIEVVETEDWRSSVASRRSLYGKPGNG